MDSSLPYRAAMPNLGYPVLNPRFKGMEAIFLLKVTHSMCGVFFRNRKLHFPMKHLEP